MTGMGNIIKNNRKEPDGMTATVKYEGQNTGCL